MNALSKLLVLSLATLTFGGMLRDASAETSKVVALARGRTSELMSLFAS